MSSEERLEAIVDELWYIADAFVGEDKTLRPLLGKLGDSIPRLWTTVDKGNPHRVALAALAVYRRFDDIFRPLRQQEGEALVTRFNSTAKAQKKRAENAKARYVEIRAYVEQRTTKRGDRKTPSNTKIRGDAAIKFHVSPNVVLRALGLLGGKSSATLTE